MKQLFNKFKKRLIGMALAVSIGAGSLVFTYTADGCQMSYEPQTINDPSGEAWIDSNGDTIKIMEQ